MSGGAVFTIISARVARLGSASRPARMVDDAPDGERGEPAAAERAQLSSRDLAAAFLRSSGSRRG